MTRSLPPWTENLGQRVRTQAANPPVRHRPAPRPAKRPLAARTPGAPARSPCDLPDETPGYQDCAFPTNVSPVIPRGQFAPIRAIHISCRSQCPPCSTANTCNSSRAPDGSRLLHSSHRFTSSSTGLFRVRKQCSKAPLELLPSPDSIGSIQSSGATPATAGTGPLPCRIPQFSSLNSQTSATWHSPCTRSCRTQ
jgi:hypothetical protein